MLRKLAAAAALWVACGSWAQQTPDSFPGTMGKPTSDPEWTEIEVPPPPALRTEGLVPVEVSGGTELRWAVDPKSVAVGADRIVRYVVVASTRSATNASYEGLNCDRAEYRVYARSSGQGWRAAETGWKPLSDSGEAQHARAIAKAGACQGHAPNGSAGQIVRDLAAPQGRKFGGSNAP
jgi:hypothetical protein